MINQFKIWIEKKILQAENDITTLNKFTFKGEKENMEKGYIADMSNQIEIALQGIYEKNYDKNEKDSACLMGYCSMRYIFDWINEKLTIEKCKTKSFIVSGGDITYLPFDISVDLNEIGRGKHLLKCHLTTYDNKIFLVPQIELKDKAVIAIPMKEVEKSREELTISLARQDPPTPERPPQKSHLNSCLVSVDKYCDRSIDFEEKISTQPFNFTSNLEKTSPKFSFTIAPTYEDIKNNESMEKTNGKTEDDDHPTSDFKYDEVTENNQPYMHIYIENDIRVMYNREKIMRHSDTDYYINTEEYDNWSDRWSD